MTNQEQLVIFKQCLKDEAEAILATIDGFGEEVIRAIEIIHHCSGKVVISGIGKSGHIGEKIAASLSSMGTPTFFMHATEGSHGDLGMLSSKDVIILISNSGETKEVLNLLPTLRQIGCPRIAIIGKPESTLGRNVDVALVYHYQSECDHLHLAPTVSSTITLAVGDALTVTLSRMRNFNSDDFHVYHPGGALGKSLEKKA
jgi:arabinose-5-phosphate isomerase